MKRSVLFIFLMLFSLSSIAASLDSEERLFLELINNYRLQHNISEMKVSEALTNAAKWLSEDMATFRYFQHQPDSQKRTMALRLSQFGYSYEKYSTIIAENIAAGNSEAAKTFEQWKNSPGHNTNMLNPSFKVIGIGRFYVKGSPYSWYWTTDFGGFVD
ncbi:MAG: CAP domain-containing protein [Pseudomonadota bacterium]|nr:CAP domain-containing protein [Pseudomonadota bacterium]